MMKLRVITIVLVLVATAQVFAQQPNEAEQLRRAERKITIGLILMGLGAVVAPLTAMEADNDSVATMAPGIGLIFIGGGVIWWGGVEHRRATQPQTAIGVSLGRRIGVQFRRFWY